MAPTQKRKAVSRPRTPIRPPHQSNKKKKVRESNSSALFQSIKKEARAETSGVKSVTTTVKKCEKKPPGEKKAKAQNQSKGKFILHATAEKLIEQLYNSTMASIGGNKTEQK